MKQQNKKIEKIDAPILQGKQQKKTTKIDDNNKKITNQKKQDNPKIQPTINQSKNIQQAQKQDILLIEKDNDVKDSSIVSEKPSNESQQKFGQNLQKVMQITQRYIPPEGQDQIFELNENQSSQPMKLQQKQQIQTKKKLPPIDELKELTVNVESGFDLQIQERIAEDINYIYDFNNYKLGDRQKFQYQNIHQSGISLLIKKLIEEPKLIQLFLAGNNLTDEGITQICYEFEKSYHIELEKIDLANNLITKFGGETLLNFIIKFKNIKQIIVDDNKIPDTIINKIQNVIDKRSR